MTASVGERWRWRKRPSLYTPKEKKNLISKVIEIVTIQVEEQQSQGGAIEPRATSSIARMVMNKWLKMFREKLDENEVKFHLCKKYVNDVMVICQKLRLGH